MEQEVHKDGSRKLNRTQSLRTDVNRKVCIWKRL